MAAAGRSPFPAQSLCWMWTWSSPPSARPPSWALWAATAAWGVTVPRHAGRRSGYPDHRRTRRLCRGRRRQRPGDRHRGHCRRQAGRPRASTVICRAKIWPVPSPGLPVVPLDEVDLRRARKKARAAMPKLPPEGRVSKFRRGRAGPARGAGRG